MASFAPPTIAALPERFSALPTYSSLLAFLVSTNKISWLCPPNLDFFPKHFLHHILISLYFHSVCQAIAST